MFDDLKRYGAQCRSVLCSVPWVVGVVLMLVAGYGMLVVHPTVNWDFSLYKGSPWLVAATFFLMGRWGFSLLTLVTSEFAPLWNDVLACCLLFAAALTWCALWQLASHGKLSRLAQMLFAALFVSFPLNHEIVLFPLAFPAIGAGYCATGLALVLAHLYGASRRRGTLALAVVALSFAISVYQPFAAVYLCGAFALLWVRAHFDDDPQARTFKRVFGPVVGLVAVLAAAIVLWLLIGKVPRIIFQWVFFSLPTTGGAADEVAWFDGRGTVLMHLARLLKGLVYHFGYSALFYEALRYFWFSLLLLIGASAVCARRARQGWNVVLALGVATSCFALSFVQGVPTYYRACQCFSILVGFAWMMVYCLCEHRPRLRCAVAVAGLFLALVQSRDLSQWFYNKLLMHLTKVLSNRPMIPGFCRRRFPEAFGKRPSASFCD